MISTDSRMISGERRSSTPSAPVAKSSAARITYALMSGPCIDLGGVVDGLACVRPEHDAADRRDEQDDRCHLEGEQVVGEEELADVLRRPEAAADVRLL